MVNENGQLSKKKQLESIRPVSFKNISPIAVNIQKKEESKPVSAKINKQVGASNNEAKLVIEKNVEPVKSQKPQSEPEVVTAKPTKTKFTKLRSLEKIREKVAEENRNNHVIELNEEELYIAWGKVH